MKENKTIYIYKINLKENGQQGGRWKKPEGR
jgi:hypothetical protein